MAQTGSIFDEDTEDFRVRRQSALAGLETSIGLVEPQNSGKIGSEYAAVNCSSAKKALNFNNSASNFATLGFTRDLQLIC